MYSRKTGILYDKSEAQKKIESFNKELREQYRQRGSATPAAKQTQSTAVSESTSNNAIANSLTALLSNDDIIIIGLILLLLLEENKDFVVIGVLAALLFLNQ